MHCLSDLLCRLCGGEKKIKKGGLEKILLGWEKKMLSLKKCFLGGLATIFKSVFFVFG